MPPAGEFVLALILVSVETQQLLVSLTKNNWLTKKEGGVRNIHKQIYPIITVRHIGKHTIQEGLEVEGEAQ